MLYLHLLSDGLSVRQDVPQVPGAQHVPQSGGGQQSEDKNLKYFPQQQGSILTWLTRCSRPRWSRR